MANVFGSEADLVVRSNDGELLAIPAGRYASQFSKYVSYDAAKKKLGTEIPDSNVVTFHTYEHGSIAVGLSGPDLAARFNSATGNKPLVDLRDVTGPKVVEAIEARHALVV